jgi:hypothetical protein
MGLTRWLAGAGIDPKWFYGAAAARDRAAKIDGEPRRVRSSSPAAEGREDTRAATLDPGGLSLESEGHKGAGHSGDAPDPGDGSGGLWETRDANGGNMPPALDVMPKCRPGSSIPNERMRPVSDPGLHLSMLQ